MEAAVLRGLHDKVYEKRKAAALEVERTVRELATQDDVKKLHLVVAQLCELSASALPISRSGAIMGLAAASCVTRLSPVPFASYSSVCNMQDRARSETARLSRRHSPARPDLLQRCRQQGSLLCV